VTPPAASDADTDRRTVGDILLARGYISEAQLEHAIASQQASGKPLGQVLVEAGAITRLELASALAEQWSDTATWLGPPTTEGKARESRRKGSSDDHLAAEAREAGYTQQLQEAVVELARRVASFEPALTELRLRVEAGGTDGGEHLLDRVDVLQDGLTVLSRRLDELTDGVERAFATVQEGSRELAGEIEDVRGAIADVSGRPVADPALGSAVETLQSRLDELTAQVAAQAQSPEHDELRSTVAELAARPAGDPSLAAAIEGLEARLDGLAADVAARPEQAALEELQARIEALAATDALDAVRAAVDEIAERPAGDPALGDAVGDLRVRLDELAAGLAARAEQGVVDDLRGAVDSLQDAIRELADRPQADPGLATRLEELTTRIEALAGTDALEAVRAAVDEIAGRPAADPELDARLGELSSRLDELTTGVAERAEADALIALRETVAELDERIGSLARAEDLESIRGSLEQAREAAPIANPELDHRLDHLVSRLDALHGRVEEVAATIGDEAPTPDPELAVTVDALAARMEELSATIGAIRDAATDESEGRLDVDLRERVEEMLADVARRADGVAAETTGAIQAWATQHAALESRIDAIAAELADARLQAMRTAAAVTPLPVAEPKPRGKAKATEEVESTGVESELERLRMAVERINLHLGERERAIGDLMRSRTQEVKVEDLAKRLAELEKGGVAPAAASANGAPAPATEDGDVHRDLRSLAQRVEEAEKAAKTDREKVLTQLERLASSIDWRFRRLETGDETAA